MNNLTVMDISRLQLEIERRFDVHIHIHDTCSGFDLSLDEPNAEVSTWIQDFMRKNGEPLFISDDGLTFVVG